MSRIRIKRHAGPDVIAGAEAQSEYRRGRNDGYSEGHLIGHEVGFAEGVNATNTNWEGQAREWANEKDRLRRERQSLTDLLQISEGAKRSLDGQVTEYRRTVRDLSRPSGGVTPDFQKGWDAMIELVRQHVIVNPSEVEWFENEFVSVLAKDAIDALKEEFGS